MFKEIIGTSLLVMTLITAFGQNDNEVVLHSGKKIYSQQIQLEGGFFTREFLMLNDGVKIPLDSVDCFYLEGDFYKVDQWPSVGGFKSSSLIPFKLIEKGYIDVYEIVYQKTSSINGTTRQNYFLNNNEWLEANGKNLKRYFKSIDKETYRKVRKLHRSTQIGETIKVVGFGMLLGGFLVSGLEAENRSKKTGEEFNLEPNPVLIGGGVLLISSFFVRGGTKDDYLQIIKDYNSNALSHKEQVP